MLIVEPCLAHYDENKVYDTRSRTVCRFQLFKHAKGQFEEFEVVIKFKAGHSEEVPLSDIEKPPEAVFTCPLRP